MSELSYNKWLKEHIKKKQSILDKLSNYSNDEIINYFNFNNMVKSEPNFCPLYKDNIKCHDMVKLNCYFCACPYFEVQADKSICTIDAKDGSSIVSKDGYVHQDCSKCTIPHKIDFIKKNF